MRHRDPVLVDDGGVGHVGGIGGARLDHRSDAAVSAQRLVRIRTPLRDDLLRALKNGLREHLAARGGVLEAEARERHQVVGAERRDDHDHERGDSGDLLRFDAHVRVCITGCSRR